MVQKSRSRWKIQVRYSKNTRPKLEVKPWGVLVTLPKGVSEDEAYRIIEKHRQWIETRYAELLEALERSKNVRLVMRSKAQFKNLVKNLVEQITKEVLGMNPCKVVIREMKTRWASCSPKGTLTINALARYLPGHLISYIIYHEVCHIIEPKHNEVFKAHLQKYCPNYKELEKELLAYEIRLRFLSSTEAT